MSSVDPFDFVTDADPGADGGDTVIWVWVTLIFIYCIVFQNLFVVVYITFHTETDVTTTSTTYCVCQFSTNIFFVLTLYKMVFNFICVPRFFNWNFWKTKTPRKFNFNYISTSQFELLNNENYDSILLKFAFMKCFCLNFFFLTEIKIGLAYILWACHAITHIKEVEKDMIFPTLYV